MKHIAIILDGNRTWATERGLPKMIGHTEGAKNVEKIGEAVLAKGIPYLTLYVLSTENLKNRSAEELDHLFSLFAKIVDYLDKFLKKNVRLQLIGNIASLPEKVQASLQKTVEATKNNTALTLTLAVNYGGRDEIVRAYQKAIDSGVSAAEINEEKLQSFLDTADLPDVDLVIRTGGHHRLSNYLPWQSTYAELYFTDTKWPAFSPADLDEAVTWFEKQKRHWGV